MYKCNENGEGWKDMEGAKKYFGCGRQTIETIAKNAKAKRKIGRRAIFNIAKMEEWLINEGSEG